MRRVLWILAITGLALGCGGGSDSVNPNPAPPPPPPSPPGAPSSLSVQAGDNQSAEPGAKVALQPVVLVQDAAGRGVGGVVVSFAVDSGGGVLQTASATSSSGGTVSLGDWTLGPAEGRNIVSVRAGGLATRVVANARYTTAEVANQTVGSGGGQVSLVGSGPLSGFSLTVPSGAFSAGVNVRVSYGSAEGIPHDTIARIASPLITVESDAPGLAENPMTLRIPARIEPGEFPLVTFVDPATGFLSALPTIDFDANGVTAEAAALTDRPLLPLDVQPNATLAHVGLPPGPAQTKARFVVQAIKFNINLLPAVTGFQPGVDDWEFPNMSTTLGLTSLGQVASERYYYLNRKSSEGPLWERFQKAKGVPTSNSAGLYWTAGLHAALVPSLQQYFSTAAAHRTANPVKYDSLALRYTVLSMVLSKGKPQVVVVLDPATQRIHPGLVYGWSGPLGHQLLVADPDSPGDGTVKQSWVNGAPLCAGAAAPCVLTVGLNYISNWLDPQWPSVLNETMYKLWFPPASIGRNLGGTAAGGSAAGVIDTIFFGRDTGSVYSLIPSWPYQLPTGLANPSTVLRTHAWFENSPGSWSASTYLSSDNLEFLDSALLSISPTNPGVDRLFGVEPRVVWPPSPGKVTEAWNGFKLYRLIKYVPKLTGVYAAPGQTTDFTVSSAGGPPLPADYVYRFDFDDGTTAVTQQFVSTIGKTYSDNAARTVRLAIIHPITRDTVARASVVLSSLAVTPNPLNGTSDTDYILTATYPRALPPNPTWAWDLGDGRTMITSTNTVTVRYPNQFQQEADTFYAKATLRSALQVVATDSTRVIIQMVRPAWKFTSVNVQFNIFQTTPGYAGFADSAIGNMYWKEDSTMLARLGRGQNEGGLLYLDKEYDILPPNFGMAKQGIYLLEGTNITKARLDTDLDFRPVTATGGPPLPGRIKNNWLTWSNYGFRQGPTSDGLYPIVHTETGTLTNGSIIGTSWVALGVAGHGYWPINVRQASITFNGNTATGTLTYTFRINKYQKLHFYEYLDVEAWRITGTLTFTAVRIR